MNARLRWWIVEWDWRPLARLLVWIVLAVVAAKRGGYRPLSLDSIARELILGWLLSFGLLTWLQIRLAAGAVWLYLTLDDWTYAASEWIVRPVAGRAPFAVNFLAALAVQLGLVLGGLAYWRAAHLGPRVLALLESSFRLLLGVV
jgi:hypothetical protein